MYTIKKLFDDKSMNWTKDVNFNLLFLRTQQQYVNDLLVARGHVFLNEIYDLLGIMRTANGSISVWIYEPENDKRDFIDFGIIQSKRSIELTFNANENILDYLQKD